MPLQTVHVAVIPVNSISTVTGMPRVRGVALTICARIDSIDVHSKVAVGLLDHNPNIITETRPSKVKHGIMDYT